MGAHQFFWHDYETFGAVPRRDRPAQFAGVRTDADLNEVEPPVMHFCRPAPDFLPEPEACLLTGITPQVCLERGLPEHAFAAAVEAELARAGTVGVGYNSIRFDDEVTRHLFWRNLIDPYAREYSNGCGRWDVLDALRCAWALRPAGIEWPRHDDGRPSFKLEHLSAANGLAHEAAHDALSDVRATLALARLLKSHQPRLWEFCLRLRRKDEVAKEIAAAQGAGRPFLHLSGMYGAERGFLAAVWPLGVHPKHKNEVIAWDLAADPTELADLDAAAIRERLFAKPDALPAGAARLPIKTIHLNRSPIVIANMRTLGNAAAERWGIDLERAARHAESAARVAPLLAGRWAEVFRRPDEGDAAVDVDQDLYGGFLSDADRRALQRLRGLAPAALAAARPSFADARLDELVWRYRARNFPDTLDGDDRARWQAHCAARLHDGAGGGLALEAFFERVDALGGQLAEDDERGQDVLGALVDYATGIAPERP